MSQGWLLQRPPGRTSLDPPAACRQRLALPCPCPALHSPQVRVMPRCWYVLLRFWLRVDHVLVRLREVRCTSTAVLLGPAAAAAPAAVLAGACGWLQARMRGRCWGRPCAHTRLAAHTPHHPHPHPQARVFCQFEPQGGSQAPTVLREVRQRCLAALPGWALAACGSAGQQAAPAAAWPQGSATSCRRVRHSACLALLPPRLPQVRHHQGTFAELRAAGAPAEGPAYADQGVQAGGASCSSLRPAGLLLQLSLLCPALLQCAAPQPCRAPTHPCRHGSGGADGGGASGSVSVPARTAAVAARVNGAPVPSRLATPPLLTAPRGSCPPLPIASLETVLLFARRFHRKGTGVAEASGIAEAGARSRVVGWYREHSRVVYRRFHWRPAARPARARVGRLRGRSGHAPLAAHCLMKDSKAARRCASTERGGGGGTPGPGGKHVGCLHSAARQLATTR